MNTDRKAKMSYADFNHSYLSRANSQRGSSGRSYSGMGSSCAELRRVVIRTKGVLEFIEELESADTYRKKTLADHQSLGSLAKSSKTSLEDSGCK